MAHGRGAPNAHEERPRLNPQQEQELLDEAQVTANDLIGALVVDDGPVTWIKGRTEGNVEMYLGQSNSNGANPWTQHICGKVRIKSSIEEVANYFSTTTTEEAKAYARQDAIIIDQDVLYSITDTGRKNRPDQRQVTIKWTVVREPSRFGRPREFITLEYQSLFTNPHTNLRGFVKAFRTIDEYDFKPPSHDYNDNVRGSASTSGYVIMETDLPGTLTATSSFRLELKGRSKAYVNSLFIRKCVLNLKNLQSKLSQYRLSNQTLLSDLELVSKNLRSSCSCCGSRFYPMSRKENCRKCGEVVCRSCAVKYTFTVGSAGSRKLRICSDCVHEPEDEGKDDEYSLSSEPNDIHSILKKGGEKWKSMRKTRSEHGCGKKDSHQPFWGRTQHKLSDASTTNTSESVPSFAICNASMNTSIQNHREMWSFVNGTTTQDEEECSDFEKTIVVDPSMDKSPSSRQQGQHKVKHKRQSSQHAPDSPDFDEFATVKFFSFQDEDEIACEPTYKSSSKRKKHASKRTSNFYSHASDAPSSDTNKLGKSDFRQNRTDLHMTTEYDIQALEAEVKEVRTQIKYLTRKKREWDSYEDCSEQQNEEIDFMLYGLHNRMKVLEKLQKKHDLSLIGDG